MRKRTRTTVMLTLTVATTTTKGDPGESRGPRRESRGKERTKPRGKQGPKKGKQGEKRGKARGKQAEKRESRFLSMQTDPLFAVPALCEIAPSQILIILEKVKGKKTAQSGQEWEGGAAKGKSWVSISRGLGIVF